MKSKFLKFFIISVAVLTIGVVYLNQSLISSWYMLGFVYFTIPFLIVLNILLLVFLAFRKNVMALFPLVALLCSYQQIRQNFNLSFKGKPEDDKKLLKIATYNVSSFYFHLVDKDPPVDPAESIRWISDNLDTDIICIQEFYNDKDNITEKGVKKLREKGYRYMSSNPRRVTRKNYLYGIITMSKYPIVESGPVKTEDDELLRSLYTDIVVGRDTLRIINVHLKSMAIRIYDNTSLDAPETVYKNTRGIARKLKKGFRQRNMDIQILGKFIKKSPYKVILCGDFNDTPYSYSYQYIRKILKNAYEETGSGFSFTYSGFPYFIRIDNQFYDPSFKAVWYTKHSNDKASEHYPVECWYDLKGGEE